MTAVPERSLPSDAPWRERLRLLVSERGTLTAVATTLSPEISKRTLEAWVGIDGCAYPSMSKMRGLEFGLGYRVVDQLLDLGLLSPGEATQGISAMPASVSVALGRLEAVVGELTANRFSVWDLARLAIRSSVETEMPGRWRSKVFDVQGGETMPHVSHHCVEFQRAHLPGHPPLGGPKDRERTLDICRALMPDESRWRNMAGFDRTHENDLHWLERVELAARLAPIQDYMVLNKYGGVGDLHVPLLNNPEQRMRHIFMDAAGAEGVRDIPRMIPLNSRYLPSSGRLSGLSGKVVVIGPSATSAFPVTRMIADAMGWPAQTVRERASAAEGQLVRISDLGSFASSLAAAMQNLAAWRPPHPTVISLGHLPWATDHPNELRHLLLDETVVPILLHPPRDLLESWHDRQARGTGDRDRVSRNQRPSDMLEAVLQIEKILATRIGPYITTRMRRPYPSLDWAARSHFIHPIIGDYTVRAAYQLAYVLATGEPGHGRSRRATRFIDGSTVATFEPTLRRASEVRKDPFRITIRNSERT